MRRILLSLAALFFAGLAGHAVPMKARVIQPLFAQDQAGLDKSFEWTLRELERCDASLDIVVLPEFRRSIAMARRCWTNVPGRPGAAVRWCL